MIYLTTFNFCTWLTNTVVLHIAIIICDQLIWLPTFSYTWYWYPLKFSTPIGVKVSFNPNATNVTDKINLNWEKFVLIKNERSWLRCEIRNRNDWKGLYLKSTNPTVSLASDCLTLFHSTFFTSLSSETLSSRVYPRGSREVQMTSVRLWVSVKERSKRPSQATHCPHDILCILTSSCCYHYHHLTCALFTSKQNPEKLIHKLSQTELNPPAKRSNKLLYSSLLREYFVEFFKFKSQ